MNFKIFVLLFLVVALTLVAAKGKKKRKGRPPCLPCQPNCPNPKGVKCPRPMKGKKTQGGRSFPGVYNCAEKGGECGDIGRCFGTYLFEEAEDCNKKAHNQECCNEAWKNDDWSFNFY